MWWGRVYPCVVGRSVTLCGGAEHPCVEGPSISLCGRAECILYDGAECIPVLSSASNTVSGQRLVSRQA